MQQKKIRKTKLQARPPNPSHIGERLSTIGTSRSHDTRSKLQSSRDSQVRQFRKGRKINTLSSIGSVGMQQQIRREIIQAGQLLKDCSRRVNQRVRERGQKEQLMQLEQLIRLKDETIKSLASEIEQLKKSDKNIPQQESQPSSHKPTADNSERERLFKLAEEMRGQREELQRCAAEHGQKLSSYLKIKRLIEEIQQRYGLKDQRAIPSYQQFKEKQRVKKEQPKVKKIDFYHHLSPDKQATPSKNMKDLITRKNITLAALKNSRKKHAVEMNDLVAKIQFLKDEDILLTQKIKEKEQQLASMQKKFSERKGENQRINRNSLIRYHS